MKVLGVAFAAFVCANAIADDTVAPVEAKTKGSDLVARLDELSMSGQPLIHKSYREDTQTVTKNADGQYVVHVDTVFGEQDDDEKPVISKAQDEFIIPIAAEELVWDEDTLNQLWNDIWDPSNTYWNEWKNDDTVNNKEIDPYFAALPGDDTWEYAPRDSVDRLLDDESAEVPKQAQDTFQYDVKSQDEDWAALRYFYDVMDFDEDTFEWELNPEKYEAKYGIKPYVEGDDLLDQRIESLDEQIDAEQAVLDFDKAFKSDLVAEKELDQEIDALAEQIEDDVAVLGLEQDLEKELEDEAENIEDIVFVDPVSGKLTIDDEAYKMMFGVYPSFDYTPLNKEEEQPQEAQEEEELDVFEPEPDFIPVGGVIDDDDAVKAEPEEVIERNFDDIFSNIDWKKALERFQMDDVVMDDKYKSSFTGYEPQMVPAVGAYP